MTRIMHHTGEIVGLFSSGFLEHTRFESGNHVLDVDKGIWAATLFQYFQSFLDQITHVGVEPLVIVYGVAHVY